MIAPPRKRPAQIVAVQHLGPGLGRIDLEGDGIGVGVTPGRFAMVEAPGRADCVLLRPFSYFLTEGPHRIALLVKDVGKGTHGMLEASVGDPISVFGPLGNHYPEPPKSFWMVAGGVGAAPFGAWAQRAGGSILFGARSVAESGFAQALQSVGGRVELATDDGSGGLHGSVVDLLASRLETDEPPEAILTCGPTPMMRAVAGVAARGHIPCWVSLEERMGCGIGVCRGCAHRDASGGWRCICVDGPVYAATDIFPSPARPTEPAHA